MSYTRKLHYRLNTYSSKKSTWTIEVIHPTLSAVQIQTEQHHYPQRNAAVPCYKWMPVTQHINYNPHKYITDWRTVCFVLPKMAIKLQKHICTDTRLKGKCIYIAHFM